MSKKVYAIFIGGKAIPSKKQGGPVAWEAKWEAENAMEDMQSQLGDDEGSKILKATTWELKEVSRSSVKKVYPDKKAAATSRFVDASIAKHLTDDADELAALDKEANKWCDRMIDESLKASIGRMKPS